MDLRNSNSVKNIISATPRQLESVIRLSEARARLRFSDYVQKEDVEEALRLIKVATQQAATDPSTGLIDMNILGTGTSSISRDKVDEIVKVIKKIIQDNEDIARKGLKYFSLFEDVKNKLNEARRNASNVESFEISEFEYRDALRNLEDEEIVARIGNLKTPLIRLIGHKQF